MEQEFMTHMMDMSDKLNAEVGTTKKKTSEGKIPTHTDDEAAKIAKLTEQDDVPTDFEDEKDFAPRREMPDKKPFGEEEPEEETKIEKEYFGSKGDEYYYMNETQSDAGEREDLQIIDAEGEKVFSALDNELDINDIVTFVVEATRQTDVDEVSRDLMIKYVFPALEKEEEEEEEFPAEGEETIAPKDEFESKVKYQDKEYSVRIESTDVFIGEKKFEFTDEFIKMYRNENGLMTKEGVEKLAIDVLETEIGEKTDKETKAEKEKEKKDKEKKKKKEKKESKVSEDLSSDVKTMAKEAETAIKDEDYAKASDLVMKLSQVQAVVPKTPESEAPKSEDELETEEPEEKEEPEETEEGKVPDKDDDEAAKINKLKEKEPKDKDKFKGFKSLDKKIKKAPDTIFFKKDKKKTK